LLSTAWHPGLLLIENLGHCRRVSIRHAVAIPRQPIPDELFIRDRGTDLLDGHTAGKLLPDALTHAEQVASSSAQPVFRVSSVHDGPMSGDQDVDLHVGEHAQ